MWTPFPKPGLCVPPACTQAEEAKSLGSSFSQSRQVREYSSLPQVVAITHGGLTQQEEAGQTVAPLLFQGHLSRAVGHSQQLCFCHLRLPETNYS